MSDGIIGTVFTNEADEDGRAAALGSGLDPAAAAIAMKSAETDPHLAAHAAAYFDTQARFVGIQSEHLHEQRELILAQQRVTLAHFRIRRINDQIRMALLTTIGLVAVGLIVALATMLYDATRADSVVVEPFATPATLAARGVTGTVLAQSLLDDLDRIQGAIHNTRATLKLTDAWSGELHIEVPETGLSLGEIERLLKAKFGHELHIRGDLVQTDAGAAALTVRGDGIMPKTFGGRTDDLDTLTRQAAEYVYGSAQPGLYVQYLSQMRRYPGAIAYARAVYPSASARERPYLLVGLAIALEENGDDPRIGLRLLRAALAFRPDDIGIDNLIARTLIYLGEEEQAWRVYEDLHGVKGETRDAAYGASWQSLTWDLLGMQARGVRNMMILGGTRAEVTDLLNIATIDVDLHDFDDAALQLEAARVDDASPAHAARIHYLQGLLAQAQGERERASVELEAAATYFDAHPAARLGLRIYDPGRVALAEQAVGRTGKADAILDACGQHLDCLRVRADILDQRGNWAGAQQAYQAGVALAPDLPAGYYSWGAALARHGDPLGAIDKLMVAHQRGPHWADPLKAWGDILTGQQKWQDALAKYDEALTYAPAWKALQAARDAALRHAG